LNVILTPLRAEHAAAIVRWLEDPTIAESLGLRSEPTLARTRSFIADAANNDSMFARAIIVDGAHVGTVVLDHIDRHIGKARAHIYIGDHTLRGRGVGREAMALVVSAGFNELDLHKIWLTVHARNQAAIRAYQAVGFAIEGVHRDEFLLAGERVDEVYMGILRAEKSGIDGSA